MKFLVNFCRHTCKLFLSSGTDNPKDFTSCSTLLSFISNPASFPFSFSFFLFQLHSQHAEISRPAIKPGAYQWPELLKWPCQILNPLSHMETPFFCCCFFATHHSYPTSFLLSCLLSILAFRILCELIITSYWLLY